MFVSEVTLRSSLGFSGVTASDLSNSSARAALESVIADTLADPVLGAPNVTITAIIDSTRRSLRSSPVDTLANNAQINFVAIYLFDSSLSVNTTELQKDSVQKFTESIQAGTFVSTLQSASPVFASASTSADSLVISEPEVITIARPTASPTAAPSLAPDKKKGNSNAERSGIIAGIVMGSIVVFALLVAGVYQFFIQGKTKAFKVAPNN